MKKKVAIGIQSFEKIIQKKCFYIDKTSFIKEWWENEDDVTLITRPRRFGKTLNMSMLEAFFSLDYAGRSELFEDFFIWKEEKYRNIQGTYPVICLSFANVKEKDFRTTRKKICQLLTNLYSRYSFLKESSILYETDRRFFDRVSEDMDDSDATLCLYQLSDYLYRYYGKKVLILIDEYDTPMQEAYMNGYWDELVAFTRSLFNSTFKTNPWLERGMMTGVTRVSKESVFSDLNNLEVVTTTSEKYADSFGFTEKEVFLALDEFSLGDKKDEVRRWYDGFIFGKHKAIYNPWSILHFLNKEKVSDYWVNTSSNALVSKLLREGSPEIKEKFEVLLRGNTIKISIDEQITYNHLDENEESIWSLLVASGYLKILSYDDVESLLPGEEQMYELALTNYEVRRMFEGMVRSWFSRAKSSCNEFVRALLSGDLRGMNGYMNQVALHTFSYFDTGKKSFCRRAGAFLPRVCPRVNCGFTKSLCDNF